MKRSVTVVGAGFSGLTIAYELSCLGFQVDVYERQGDTGGLISTARTTFGLAESAANALIACRDIEELFDALSVEFAARKPEAKKRFIYWGDGPKRWPLSVKATLHTIFQGIRLALGQKAILPYAGESIAKWGERFAGEEFTERLLAPAMQGIYAGDPNQMSAVLILNSMLSDRPPRGDLKGSVAPKGGMGELIKKLKEACVKQGVRFHFKSEFAIPEYVTSPIVIATSAWHAEKLLKSSHPEVAHKLGQCESLGLVSATCFFQGTPHDLKGFGCLFPRSQGFSSLGVLFNNCVFSGRSKARSETWILGGASFQDCVAESDEDILRRIMADREKMGQSGGALLDYRITRWPRALPHYTVDWEKTLKHLRIEPPFFLHGNYLGQLGLARIYLRSKQLAQEIQERYG